MLLRSLERSPKQPQWVRYCERILVLYAIAQILWVGFLGINHINFPLNLEAMELTVLQHIRRVIAGLPLYPAPSTDFIALAYNPLFYYVCVPFVWMFGAHLPTIRLVAILGLIGCGAVIFWVLRYHTQSNRWAIFGVGLFAAAYRVMDTYLDTAHQDSWLLLLILLGCYRLDRAKSLAQNCLGLLLLMGGFWVKQQGSIFIVGALLFLTWREPFWKSWLYWLLAISLGPVLYLTMPDRTFGPYFHYFTWQVPRQWVEVQPWEIMSLVRLSVRFYGLLILVSAIGFGRHFLRWKDRTLPHRPNRWTPSIWAFMLPFACFSGLLATLTPGSNYNVFIPMWTWFTIFGVLSLHEIVNTYRAAKHWGMHIIVIGLSFLLIWYNPLTVMVSPQAKSGYQTFLTTLKALDGPVYAPAVGPLQEDGYQFYPGLLWVPLEDIIRRPGVQENNHPTARKILAPVVYPKRQAYLLMNAPLEQDGLLAFLSDQYTLKVDFKDQFKALETLPRRFYLAWPRYLYQYSPK